MTQHVYFTEVNLIGSRWHRSQSQTHTHTHTHTHTQSAWIGIPHYTYKVYLQRLFTKVYFHNKMKLSSSVAIDNNVKWILSLQQTLQCYFKTSVKGIGLIHPYNGCCCGGVTSVVSNSVQPHRRQPTRLPRPWDSPGKNTGVGCHFLLQCMKVKSESEVAQSCPTLSNPMDCSLPGSSIHGILQARVLEWGAIAFFTMDTTEL